MISSNLGDKNDGGGKLGGAPSSSSSAQQLRELRGGALSAAAAGVAEALQVASAARAAASFERSVSRQSSSSPHSPRLPSSPTHPLPFGEEAEALRLRITDGRSSSPHSSAERSLVHDRQLSHLARERESVNNNEEISQSLTSPFPSEVRAAMKRELLAEIRAEIRAEVRAEIRAEVLAEPAARPPTGESPQGPPRELEARCAALQREVELLRDEVAALRREKRSRDESRDAENQLLRVLNMVSVNDLLGKELAEAKQVLAHLNTH